MFRIIGNEYKKYSSLRGSIIIIEGNIGVGKSTLGKNITKFLNDAELKTKFFPEYVNDLFLKKYIDNMQVYALGFQIMMLLKRIEVYKEAINFAQCGGISIIDRGLIGDLVFAGMLYKKGIIDDDGWSIYKSMQDNTLVEPHCVLYLKCSIETAMRRIMKRGNNAEKGYSMTYLSELSDAYESKIKELEQNIIEFDWNEDIIINDFTISNILTKIIKGFTTC